MVQNYGNLAAGSSLSYIGRRLDPTQGKTFEDVEIVRGTNGREQHVNISRRMAVLVPHPEQVVFEYPTDGPHAGEYLRHLRDGDLIPADQFTADQGAHLGVSPVNGHECKFDPTFARSLHKMHVEESTDDGAEESKAVLEAVTQAIGSKGKASE
jgi:hypothetical protein